MEPRKPKAEFATEMRRKPTPMEALMYNALLEAFRPYQASIFAQQVIGPYIADFLIVPGNIVLEVDGSIHNSEKQRKYDRSRDTYMRHSGLSVVRVTNLEVQDSSKRIAQEILTQCGQLRKREDQVKITYCAPARAKKWKTKEFIFKRFI